MTSLQTHVNNLTAYKLHTSKCTKQTSFHHQIFSNFKGCQDNAMKRQKEQFFNLGNGQTFTDPLSAADYLLEREYSETFLFDHEQYKENIFIPPVFVSNLYKQDISYLDHDIEKQLRKSEKNRSRIRPDDWFTKELSAFIINNPQQITNPIYLEWITKVKCLCIIRHQLSSQAAGFPSIDQLPNDMRGFLFKCSHEISLIDERHPLVEKFKLKAKLKKEFQKKLNIFLKKNLPPCCDPVMNWCFQLEMADIGGEMPEYWLFETLQEILGADNNEERKFHENMVVLHACDITFDDKMKTKMQEFDFLIFMPSRKLIVGIEVKKTLLKETSLKQLIRYRETLEERLGDQLDDDWTFFPVLFVFMPTRELIDALDSNAHFIHPEKDIKVWLNGVMHCFSEFSTGLMTNLKQLRNTIKILLFVLQISKPRLPHVGKGDSPVGTVIPSKWIKFVTEAINIVSTTNNIIFYSKNQLPIMLSEDARYQKIILKGGYGSGKTFLMKEKILSLAKRGEKCVYVMGKSCQQKTLLQIQLEEEWKHYEDTIEVFNMTEVAKFLGIDYDDSTSNGTLLLQFAQKKKGHLFLDEMDINVNDECILKFSQFNKRVVWISFYSLKVAEIFNQMMMNLLPIPDQFSNFQIVELPYSMRNSRNIIKFTEQTANRFFASTDPRYSLLVTKPPENFPAGILPKNHKTIAEALSTLDFPKKKGILIVSTFPGTEGYQSAIKAIKDLDSSCKVGYYSASQRVNIDETINEYVVKPGECLSYLREGILLTDGESVEGFEWPLLAYHTATLGDFSNIMMRCLVHLAYCNEERPISTWYEE